MALIISIHSFRGGTGKSNTTANVTVLLAAQGLRVGVVDTDIQSPGIHVLFGLDEEAITHSLNDYLWGKCEIEQAAQDVTDRLGTPISGRIFLIPSSIKAGEIAKVLREGYDVGLLNDGFHRLVEALELDVPDDRHAPRSERGDAALNRDLGCADGDHAAGQPRLPGHRCDYRCRAQAGCARSF